MLHSLNGIEIPSIARFLMCFHIYDRKCPENVPFVRNETRIKLLYSSNGRIKLLVT